MERFKVLNLDQSSEQWLLWREGQKNQFKVGGSDIASILDCSPYKTRKELMVQKQLRTRPESEFQMRKGTWLEPVIRQHAQSWLETMTEVPVALDPCCVELVDDARFIASLDGTDWKEQIVAELKYNNWKTHDFALCGIVQEHHMVQVQYQLWLTGLDTCFYFSHSDNGLFDKKDQFTAGIQVRSSPEIQGQIVEKVVEFLDELERAFCD